MNHAEVIAETIRFVKETLKEAEGGHDWFHIQRIFNNSLLIARNEEVDTLIVSLGALLHDIADAKFHSGDETIGPKMAKAFLEAQNLDASVVAHVVNIVEHSSFKSSLDTTKPHFHSKELFVVQDADRLDALGAIGIARAFAYGGFTHREIYNPHSPPNLAMTKAEYKNSTSPTINHFYEKLLLLKDRMHTATGKRLAVERHHYLLQYLQQFFKEWNGEA